MDKPRCMENEIEDLKNENEYLKCCMKDLEGMRDKNREELELAQKKIGELEKKVEFFAGQIDAYQYCLNSCIWARKAGI